MLKTVNNPALFHAGLHDLLSECIYNLKELPLSDFRTVRDGRQLQMNCKIQAGTGVRD